MNNQTMMEIPEILEHLQRCRVPFPSAAVAEASNRRDEITPELLRILDTVAANPAPYATDGDYFGHIFAMFLLAKFRETRAYPVIIRMVSIPGETVFELLGDVVTENLGSILASVCGGDDAGIKSLIENSEADEFVRSAALRALVTLVATGQRSRDEVMEYLTGLYHRLDRHPSYVWSDLANRCADLCPLEVQDEILQAYRDGLIDRKVIHPDDVRDAIDVGIEGALKKLPRRKYRLVDDVEREMSWMSGFQERVTRADAPIYPEEEEFDEGELVEPYRREGPKVGRNDPCPCGSGKKFKKCCGK